MRKTLLALIASALLLAATAIPALANHGNAVVSVDNVDTRATAQNDAADAGNAGSDGAESAADGAFD